jgi:hypothetical protein
MSRTLVEFTALVLIVALVASPLAPRATAEITAVAVAPKTFTVQPKFVFGKAPPLRFMMIERGGTYVTFKFTTRPNEIPRISLAKVPLVVATDWRGFSFIVNFTDILHQQQVTPANLATGSPVEITFMDLEPGTQYFYVVRTLGVSTPVPAAVGSFWTKVRHVHVTFGMIQVNDDTDDFGTGEFAFRYQLFHPGVNIWAPNASLAHENDPPGGYYDIASGDSYWPLVTLHSPLVGEELVVAISALEDDAPWNYGANHAGDQFRGWGGNDDYEWNSGAVTVPLTGLTLATPSADSLAEAEEFYQTFFIDVTETDDTCMEYTLWAEVHMTYE